MSDFEITMWVLFGVAVLVAGSRYRSTRKSGAPFFGGGGKSNRNTRLK